jgi:hypothetical protein
MLKGGVPRNRHLKIAIKLIFAPTDRKTNILSGNRSQILPSGWEKKSFGQ